MKPAVSVIGLGKLGACMAAAMAARGFRTTGVDTNPATLALLARGQAPVVEPGLEDLLARAGSALAVTEDCTAAVRDSDVTFLIVPSPSTADGAFALDHLRRAAAAVGRALAAKPSYHVVVVTSTVLPGSTEHGILPVIEEASGKRAGDDFGLCYSPEFIALGSVIRDFLNPDFVLIGELDRRSGDRLQQVYEPLWENQPRSARMSIVNAELTKIALNTYVTTKITFANMLAELCEKLPGGDVDVVTDALGLDSRIGRKYLKGALGYGGTCFPRDNQALSYLLERLGAPATLPRAIDSCNQRQVGRIVAMAQTRVAGAIGVLGLAFKPDTNVVEQSQGLLIAAELAAGGRRVVVYDPAAQESARQLLGDTVAYAKSAAALIESVDLVIVATPWPEFADLDYGAGKPIVLDAWRMLGKRPANWQGIGVGARDPQALADLTATIEQMIARIVDEAE